MTTLIINSQKALDNSVKDGLLYCDEIIFDGKDPWNKQKMLDINLSKVDKIICDRIEFINISVNIADKGLMDFVMKFDGFFNRIKIYLKVKFG